MCFFSEPDFDCRKPNLPSAPASPGRGSAASKVQPPSPPASTSSNASQTLSASRSRNSSSIMVTTKQWTTRNLLVVPSLPDQNSLMPERYSTPSTKQPAGQVDDIQPQGGPAYLVDFHAGVVRTIQRYGIQSADFNPTLGRWSRISRPIRSGTRKSAGNSRTLVHIGFVSAAPLGVPSSPLTTTPAL